MSLLRLRKRRIPNVVRGGRAIPLDNNGELYYLQGRSHAQGGIDIGRNPRTGIEAEGGEIVQMKPNELRVLSAQDFIGGGVSPAKQVLAGADPDKVFNEQERFKDRHRLNDDGSKYENGGDVPQYIKDYALQRQIKVAKNDKPLNNVYPESIILGLGKGLYNAFGKPFINLSKEFTKKQIRQIKGAKEIGKEIASETGEGIILSNIDNIDNQKQNGGMIATINGNIKNGLITTPRFKSGGGIHIDPSKRGTFTAAAKAHGKSVQGFASQVLANKDNYSSAMVKKANFARNASKWNHKSCGGRKKAEGGTKETIYDAIDRMNREQIALQDSIDNGYYIETDSGFVRNPNILPDIVVTPGINPNSVDAISGADAIVDETHQMDTPIEKQLDEVVVTAKRKPKYSKRQQAFYDRGGYNHPAYDSYLPKRKGVKPDNGGINLSDESVPRAYQGKGSALPDYLKRPSVGVLDYDKIQEQEIQDLVDRFTIKDIVPRTKNNSNKKESKSNESNTSSTGSQNKSTQSTNSDSSSSSSSQTPRRRSNQSTSTSNTYSVTNYEIQSDGTVKANGTRTGQGFRRYNRRSNQRTITDARVSKPWRETIGSDADVLNYIANGDAFEHKRWQDRHSKMNQETGYDYSKKRAIQHEDVSGYSRDFNEKFNLANRKLGHYTTPAGRTGDNAQGERRKKFGGRRLAPNGTTTNLERPYEDDWYGAQVEMRQLGKNLDREDYKYLQEQINARRQSPLKRAVFEREDGYAGVIDEMATPELKGLDIAAPKIDLGPISKTEVPKANARVAQQDALNRAPLSKNYRDEIGLGLGLAGSLLDPILRGRKLRDLRSWNPNLEAPVKLKTNWNINPQLDRIRESSQEAYRDIDANTASSANALARKQRVRNQAQYAANEQWATKENKETELINQDKINRQGVRNRNANRLNTWAADDARIRNQITLAKADNISNAIQNVVGVGLDYLGRKDFKDYVNNTKAAIATANPNVDDRIYITNGMGYGNPYNTGIPTLATNTYRRSRFGSRTRLNRR